MTPTNSSPPRQAHVPIKHECHNGGYSLVELVITLPIIAAFFFIMMQFHLASSDAVATLFAETTLQSGLDLAMRNILTDVRLAFWQAPTKNTCNNFREPDTDTICLWLPALNTSGQPLDNVKLFPSSRTAVDLIVYDFDPAAGILTRTVNYSFGASRPLGTRTVARDLTTVSFATTTSGNGKMQDIACTLTGRRLARGRPIVQTLIGRAKLRNF